MHWNVGLSFDRMREYLSWPADHPYRLAAQTQVIRLVAMVAAKVDAEAARERDRSVTPRRARTVILGKSVPDGEEGEGAKVKAGWVAERFRHRS